ncbi:MAG: DinB family protein [Planctomycetes bacterium]|nr:DinB family protein [Planctomycetota bacterium]
MDAVAALLQSFDDAWKDPFESLTDACVDLTEEESVWQPPAYKREPHDKGVGRPGSILWHLNHLEMCHRHYIATLKTRDPDNSPDTDPPGELALKPALKALGDATLELREVIAELKPEDLSVMVRPKMSIAGFVAMLTRHITWHAAQIKQTRRLHATRARTGKVDE